MKAPSRPGSLPTCGSPVGAAGHLARESPPPASPLSPQGRPDAWAQRGHADGAPTADGPSCACSDHRRTIVLYPLRGVNQRPGPGSAPPGRPAAAARDPGAPARSPALRGPRCAGRPQDRRSWPPPASDPHPGTRQNVHLERPPQQVRPRPGAYTSRRPRPGVGAPVRRVRRHGRLRRCRCGAWHDAATPPRVRGQHPVVVGPEKPREFGQPPDAGGWPRRFPLGLGDAAAVAVALKRAGRPRDARQRRRAGRRANRESRCPSVRRWASATRVFSEITRR